MSKLGFTFPAAAALALASALATAAPLSAALAGDPTPKRTAAVTPDHGVPKKNCRTAFGYSQQGAFLCMTGQRGPASFANAMLDCMDIGARVEDYHDWRYRTFRGDGAQAPRASGSARSPPTTRRWSRTRSTSATSTARRAASTRASTTAPTTS